MKANKSMRGYGPSLPVHKTFLRANENALENIAPNAPVASVHLNSFLWTLRPTSRTGAQL
jgi:hypothetical protein